MLCQKRIEDEHVHDALADCACALVVGTDAFHVRRVEALEGVQPPPKDATVEGRYTPFFVQPMPEPQQLLPAPLP